MNIVVSWTSLSMLPCRLGFIKRGIEVLNKNFQKKAQYNKWPQMKNFDFQLNISYWDWLLLWSNILLLPVYFESVWAFYATSWVLTCIGRALHCFPFGPVGLGFIKRGIGAQYKDMRDVDLKYWVMLCYVMFIPFFIIKWQSAHESGILEWSRLHIDSLNIIYKTFFCRFRLPFPCSRSFPAWTWGWHQSLL